ncbi:MAG: hypothetical protein ACYTF5_21840 [Planctomycetota bacterium]|jgi:hypothetical protein
MTAVVYSELAAIVLAPHFDAVRDVFADFSPDGAQRLSRLKRTRLLVDPSVRDGDRHYAGCREDGMQIVLAPDAADLPVTTLVAIVAHEFGHAADFAYPGSWLFLEQGKPAQWVEGVEGKRGTKMRALWSARDDDQVEWTADSIVQAVTGRQIGYCGRCMLQCFDAGKTRPRGLR